MRDNKFENVEHDLKKKAALLTVTGRYRESLNIMIYLMDSRNRGKSTPVIMPQHDQHNSKVTKY